MSNLTSRKAKEIYTDALEVTDEIQAPALGFIRPDSYKGPGSSFEAIIKQNNTILCLLIDLAGKIENLETQVATLRNSFKESVRERSTDELLKKLEGLSLSEPGETSKKKPEAQGQLRVFVDPKVLIEKARKEKS